MMQINQSLAREVELNVRRTSSRKTTEAAEDLGGGVSDESNGDREKSEARDHGEIEL